MSAMCSVWTDARSKGVCIAVSELDDRTHKVIRMVSVIYTPELAREIARNIEIEAEKIESTGGSSVELTKICQPAERRLNPKLA